MSDPIKNYADMTDEEVKAENLKRGFVWVATFDGYEIYKTKNSVGGWTYLSNKNMLDEGFLPIWDDCIGSIEELMAIAKDCYGLELTAP